MTMQIHITGRNISLTPALKSYVEEKMTALEKKYNHITQIFVTLHVENVTQTAEATVHLNGDELHASAEADDMYPAIELLSRKLETQITKYKDKIIDSHR